MQQAYDIRQFSAGRNSLTRPYVYMNSCTGKDYHSHSAYKNTIWNWPIEYRIRQVPELSSTPPRRAFQSVGSTKDHLSSGLISRSLHNFLRWKWIFFLDSGLSGSICWGGSLRSRVKATIGCLETGARITTSIWPWIYGINKSVCSGA